MFISGGLRPEWGGGEDGRGSVYIPEGTFRSTEEPRNLTYLGHISNQMTVDCASQAREPCGRVVDAVVQTVAMFPIPCAAKGAEVGC